MILLGVKQFAIDTAEMSPVRHERHMNSGSVAAVADPLATVSWPSRNGYAMQCLEYRNTTRATRAI